jgi:hypothetical protein
MKLTLNYKSPEFILGAFLLLLSIIYIITIFSRIPNGDEGLQAEHIYFLNKLGYVKSNIWEGYDFGWEIRQYHYHKGIVLLGFFAIKIFGFSLPALRLVSVLFYLWFAFLAYRYFNDSVKQKSTLLFLLLLLVLLLNTVFYEYIFIFRPEVMMMTFGFASFYYLDKGLKANSTKSIIFGGVFAGLAALMHLIGLTLMVAGGLTLLFNKKLKYVLVFSAFSILGLSIYFYDLLSKEAFEGFIHQFFNEASLAKKQESPFGKILEEHIRFFNSPKEIIFSTLFFFSLFLNFNYLRKNYGNFLLYGLSSIVALAFLAPNTTNKYALLYYPFMGLTIALSLYRFKEFHRAVQVAFAALFLIYSGYHIGRSFQLSSEHVSIAKHNMTIANELPVKKNVNVFASESFVFNEIENFTIHSWLAFHRYYTKRQPGYTPSKKDFMEFCDKLDDRYLIFDKKLFQNALFHYTEKEDIEVGEQWENYQVIVSRPDLLILENTRLAKN